MRKGTRGGYRTVLGGGGGGLDRMRVHKIFYHAPKPINVHQLEYHLQAIQPTMWNSGEKQLQ